MCRSAGTRRTSARITGVLALLVFLLGVQASSASALASAAASVMAAGSLSAPQGATITITGTVSSSTTCPSGAPVQLTSTPVTGTTNLFPNGMGPQVPRDAGGNFKATFVIPASTPVGAYTIGVQCGGAAATASETLNVTAGPHATPSITVSPASAQPGDTVTIAGVVPTSGTVFCPSGDATQLTSTSALFPPDGSGPQVSRDATGNFHASFTIPGATTPGTYTIGVRCGGGDVGIMATLQVTAAVATTTTAPSTTTTSTSTTLAPSTTAPATTTAPAPTSGKSKSSHSSLRWVALGVLALVVLAGAGVFFAQRGSKG